MNVIRTVCPACNARIKCSVASAGRKANCPSCKGSFTVPMSASPPVANVPQAEAEAEVFLDAEMATLPKVSQPIVQTGYACPDCGTSVSQFAFDCPKCGYPLREREPRKQFDDRVSSTVHVTINSPKPALPSPGNGIAIASFVLGVVALGLAFVPCLGFAAIPIALVAVLMGIIGFVVSLTRNGEGLVFSIVGTVLGGLVSFIVWIFLAAAAVVATDIATRQKGDVDRRPLEKKPAGVVKADGGKLPTIAEIEAERRKRRQALEAEASAKNEANRKQYETAVAAAIAEHESKMTQYKRDLEAYKVALGKHEISLGEIAAATKMAAAKGKYEKAIVRAKTNINEAEKLLEVAENELKDLAKAHPDTQAARDARTLLKSGKVESRPIPKIPPAPAEPVGPKLALPSTPVPIVVPSEEQP